jgi:hypothetical protein
MGTSPPGRLKPTAPYLSPTGRKIKEKVEAAVVDRGLGNPREETLGDIFFLSNGCHSAQAERLPAPSDARQAGDPEPRVVQRFEMPALTDQEVAGEDAPEGSGEIQNRAEKC